MKHNRCGSIPWSTTCLCCPRKNSVETLCCQEFLQILWWNCNKFCQDWLKIISVFIHTHWNPVLKHIHITSSKVILENCSHVFTPSRPLIVAIVSPQYYRHTAISTTSPILKHHEGGSRSSIGQGLGGILFNVASETQKCNWAATKTNSTTKCKKNRENLFHNRLFLSKIVIISGEVSAKCSNLIVSKLKPKLLINLWP